VVTLTLLYRLVARLGGQAMPDSVLGVDAMPSQKPYWWRVSGGHPRPRALWGWVLTPE
jgi:hypothetical protein